MVLTRYCDICNAIIPDGRNVPLKIIKRRRRLNISKTSLIHENNAVFDEKKTVDLCRKCAKERSLKDIDCHLVIDGFSNLMLSITIEVA